ncbi:hypothetical protein HZ320_00005 [[Pasteurella] aerogenes]|nr:hypothetical protein HZ320_00005 [[Pasteurella] aerogenes]
MKEITDKERLDFLQNKRVEIVQESEEELQLCIHDNGIIEDVVYCENLRDGIDRLIAYEMGARNEFC